LDPTIWTGWESHLHRFLTAAGCQQYHRVRRQSFNLKFQEWMDNQVPDTPFDPFDFYQSVIQEVTNSLVHTTVKPGRSKIGTILKPG